MIAADVYRVPPCECKALCWPGKLDCEGTTGCCVTFHLDDEDSLVVEDGSIANTNSERQLFFVDTQPQNGTQRAQLALFSLPWDTLTSTTRSTGRRREDR